MHKSFLIIIAVIGFVALLIAGSVVGVTVGGKISRQRALEGKTSQQLFKEGLTFIAQQEYGEAEMVLSEAASREPGNLDYLYQLAMVKYNLADYDQAIELYQKIIATKETAFAWNNLGNCFKQKKESEKAKDAYHKAISLDAGFLVAYSNLAFILNDEDNHQEALDTLKQGVKTNPRSEELKKVLKDLQK